MGNPLLKNYNLDKTPFTQGGFRDLWDIYHGSRKDRQQDVCIFIHEKKNLDKYSKEEKEEILNILKKEAGALGKFKHPLVLSLVDPLLEDKTTLIFVTERFNMTLTKFAESPDTSRLELKLLILELCNVISFMHNDAKVIIASLNPESILITSNGKLKLSGLAFSLPDPPIGGTKYKLETSFPNATPLLKFIAPEIIYDGKINYQSDIFSLGILIHFLFKLNANPQNDSDRDLIPINSVRNTVDSYKSAYDSFDSRISKIRFDPEDNDIIIKSTTKNMDIRPTINEIMDLSWFNDPKLKAFKFIENLDQNDPAKNTEFLNKFSNILNIFELKIIEKRFLPSFIRALKNENMIVHILPIIFNICQIPSIKVDFEANVWPALKTVFALKQIPAAALYFILSKINLIAEKISNSEFSSNMLNIICKALDCGVAKIQSVVMENLSFTIKKIDSLALKNQVFPRLVNIVLNTNSNTLKVTILKSFLSIYSLLDQNIINESLLNTLEKIRKNDNTGEVCVSLVKIYEEISKVVSVESIANKIMPNLISILVKGNISKKSFEEIMNLIQKYLNRIKESREKDLNIDDPNDKNSTEPSQPNISNSSSNNQGASTNKSDGNELSFLDSFFGEKQIFSSSNKVSSPNFNNFNNENNKGSDIDFITKSLEEATKKSNDKPKSIFDGIEDKNKGQSNNNLYNSSLDNKFKLNKPSTNQEKKSDLAGFNFDFNNNANKAPNNNMPSLNLNAAANKPANNNILDSLLNDLPQVNYNSSNQQNNNNLFNNLGNSNNLGFGKSASSQNKNVDLNDEYDLDFLKPSGNKNKSNTDNSFFNMGNNTQNNNTNNFDFSGFGNNNNYQKPNNNMNSLNFNNTNNNMNSLNFNNTNNNMNSLNFNNTNNNNNNFNNLGSLFPNQQPNTIDNNFNMNMGNSNNANNNLFNFTNNFGNPINNQNNKNLNKNNKSDNLFDGLLNM